MKRASIAGVAIFAMPPHFTFQIQIGIRNSLELDIGFSAVACPVHFIAKCVIALRDVGECIVDIALTSTTIVDYETKFTRLFGQRRGFA